MRGTVREAAPDRIDGRNGETSPIIQTAEKAQPRLFGQPARARRPAKRVYAACAAWRRQPQTPARRKGYI